MQRPGNYWHMLPEYGQARKAIWNAINPATGMKRIDEAFPKAIRARTNEKEMAIHFKSGSTWQLVGSDSYDQLVGSPPVGLVFSEFALANPSAWAYLSTILEENGGWALFVTTPRGRNHAATFYEAATRNPKWFAELIPATQTNVFKSDSLEEIRQSLIDLYGDDMGDATFRQEYFCSFSAAMVGSYYGKEMERAETEGRIGNVPWVQSQPVVTSWDLGMSDATAIWCSQIIGREIRHIDYIENSGVGIDWYVRELQQRNYTLGATILPHDASVRELGTGMSRVEVMRSLGMRDVRIIPAQNVQDGINAVRMMLGQMWFDQTHCKKGIAALQNYRRQWDDKRRIYNDAPYHDWASHGSDSMRYFCLGNRLHSQQKRDIKYDFRGIR
jgi:hypothetical protein